MVGTYNELKVTPAGLVLYHKNACFGTSQNSFVECKCCGAGVVKAKCPFIAKKQMCWNINILPSDGCLSLEIEHPYYN